MHGIMPCGTTGETALLEADEVITVVETVVEAAARPRAGRRTRRPPEHQRDGQADRARHRRRRAGRLRDRPLLLRLRRPRDRRPLPRAPEGQRTARRCSPTTSRPAPPTASAPRCSPHSSPRGSPGSRTPPARSSVQEAFLAAAPDAQIFVGSPSLMLGSLRRGARGSVAALANLRPDLIVALAQAWRGRRRRRGRAPAGGDRRARPAAEVGPPALVTLKTDVAEAMAARGARYPSALRSPLGT